MDFSIYCTQIQEVLYHSWIICFGAFYFFLPSNVLFVHYALRSTDILTINKTKWYCSNTKEYQNLFFYNGTFTQKLYLDKKCEVLVLCYHFMLLNTSSPLGFTQNIHTFFNTSVILIWDFECRILTFSVFLTTVFVFLNGTAPVPLTAESLPANVSRHMYNHSISLGALVTLLFSLSLCQTSSISFISSQEIVKKFIFTVYEPDSPTKLSSSQSAVVVKNWSLLKPNDYCTHILTKRSDRVLFISV